MDGQMKRVQKTLEQTLWCILSNWWLAEPEWADVVGIVELAINMTVTSERGEVPIKLDVGEVLRMVADVVVDRQATAGQPAAKAFSMWVHKIVKAMQDRL